MLGKTMLWASEKPRVQRFVTEGRLTRQVVERFVAGAELEDAIRVIKDLNAKGIGGILDLLGEGVTDLSGVRHAVADHGSPSTPATRTWQTDAVPASGHPAESNARPSGAGDASIARAHRAPTEHRSR